MLNISDATLTTIDGSWSIDVTAIVSERIRAQALTVGSNRNILAEWLGSRTPRPEGPKALKLGYSVMGVELRRTIPLTDDTLSRPLALGRVDRDCELPRGAPREFADYLTRSSGPAMEIGGPSPHVFGTRSGLFPFYAREEQAIDNIVFAAETVWQKSGGGRFRVEEQERGNELYAEANDIPRPDGSYQWVLSSHTLEHCANPLGALRESARLLAPGGHLVCVLPWKIPIFDWKRPYTSWEHLLEDERVQQGEDDLTHLDEIMAHHDLTRDPEAGTREGFRARSLENGRNRCLHHHVFHWDTIVPMIRHVGLTVVDLELIYPCHLFLIARK